ncbi:MAG: hypothetical protein JWP88_1156 [Flaviaesturariibacter sp.]|nr:hypothetical protein [Flaviaesturariibacter sp.]
MPFVFNRYSGLLLIFFVHGAVYAALLFHRGIKNNRTSDKWLALFLLLCILFICPWMLGFAGWYDGYDCLSCRNIMFYMPMQHGLLMGPVIYFYLQTLFHPGYDFRRRGWLHFLPGGAYLLWSGIVAVTDRVVLKKYFLMNGVTDPDLDDWYVAMSLVSLLVYLLLSLRLYRSYKLYILQQTSFADAVMFRWVQRFLICSGIYFCIALLFNALNFVGIELDYTGNWWYYLLFGIIFYYIAIQGYANSIEARTAFGLEVLSETEPAPAQEQLFENRLIEPATEAFSPEITIWKDKISAAIVGERLYTNPSLTLADLAKHLQTNTALVSRVINSGFSMNFNDFINCHRVAEVKERLQNAEASTVTIMSIAYEAGFNSKATFNRAFKKFTGGNPKDFAR